MPTLEQRQDYFAGHFSAMASPCEVLIDTPDKNIARQAVDIAAKEAARIEHKFSRYRDDNIIHQINSGRTVTVDDEAARLLDYADQLFRLSSGLFDITAGVLRRAWRFDGSDNIPDQAEIDALLPLIGWDKVQWKNPVIMLPAGMEIDLGGIGKEYAVDRAAQQVQSYLQDQGQQVSALINFGGDIAVLGPTNQPGRTWTIGVDTGIDGAVNHDSRQALFTLTHGGVATSGDGRRYLQRGDTRYGHILDPRSGWPVADAPSSVTVAAATCTDAGMLSTFALLHGSQAEEFLRAQGVKHWLRW
jgi:thiamine biosynthesis lipoprotein